MLALPRARRAVAALVLIAFVGAESGCSWIFVKKEPPLPIEPTPPVECTTDRTAPVLDLVTGSLFGLGALGGVALSFGCLYESCGTASDFWSILGVTLGVAAVATVAIVSGAYGLKHTKECETLKSLQASCVSGDQDACAKLRGVQPGPSETPTTPPAEPPIIPPAEVWLRDAAGLTSARLWPTPEQDR